MNAGDQFLSALLFWGFAAAIAVGIGTLIWGALYAAVSIPLAIIGL